MDYSDVDKICPVGEFHCSLRPIAASGHTASKAPDLPRTPKRSGQVERDHKTCEGLVYLYPDPV